MGPSLFRRGKSKANRIDQEKERETSKEIDKRLKDDKKKRDKELRVLLLGAADSGKSTIIKQMRIIHHGGFADEERRMWKTIIFRNLVDAFLYLVNIMAQQNAELQASENIRYFPLLVNRRQIGRHEALPYEYFDCFQDLWADASLQLAILKNVECVLSDNLVYFMEDLDRLFEPNYLPSNQDILYAKSRTIGIVETVFELQDRTFRMVDVGGQRSERRKWIKAFDSIDAVLFVAAISAYDVFVPEDPNQSQVEEALMLFRDISNLPIFKRAALVLFLNKVDLLQEKLQMGMSPIARYYPDYTGDPADVQAGQAYFATKFKRLYRDPDKQLYIHFTNATDTDILQFTMDSVQLMILQHNFNTILLN